MTDPIYLQLCALVALLTALCLWLMFLRSQRAVRELLKTQDRFVTACATATAQNFLLYIERSELRALAGDYQHDMRIWRSRAVSAESQLFLARAEQAEAQHAAS